MHPPHIGERQRVGDGTSGMGLGGGGCLLVHSLRQRMNSQSMQGRSLCMMVVPHWGTLNFLVTERKEGPSFA